MKIELKEWDYSCYDGCCYEWGTNLYVDGELLGSFNDEYTLLELLLPHLGIKDFEIEEVPYEE